MKTKSEILAYIELVRESVPDAVDIFTRGNCTSFARMLEWTFPGGQVKHDLNHAYYKYNKECYDITGDIKEPKNGLPIEDYGIREIMSLTKNNYAG